MTNTCKNIRPTCLCKGASEVSVCRVADFDLELARTATAAKTCLDDAAKLAGIDVSYNSTFHLCKETMNTANATRAGR